MSEETEVLGISDRFIDQPERTPRQVEQMVMAVTPSYPREALSAALDVADWLAGRSRAIHMASRKIGIAWIEKNGEFDIGPMRYSVGYTTTTKCIDVPGCGMVLLEALGGDFEAFLKVLGSNAYKYGVARSILDRNVYGSFFHTSNTSRLVNGVPERTPLRSDPTYALRKSVSRESK